MRCLDADVLIYAAIPDHPLGSRVRALLDDPEQVCAGSVLLLPEVLGKPLRDGRTEEIRALTELLRLIHLHPLDLATAEVATALSGRYGLRAADAAHLATAVIAGADQFVTNNRRDFPTSITEVDVLYPDDLPEA